MRGARLTSPRFDVFRSIPSLERERENGEGDGLERDQRDEATNAGPVMSAGWVGWADWLRTHH